MADRATAPRWRPYEIRRRAEDGRYCVWRRRPDPAWQAEPAPPEIASPWVCIAVCRTPEEARGHIPPSRRAVAA